MTLKTPISLVAALVALSACGAPVTTVNQAVNSFQNSQATAGAAMTVDVKGPATISDSVEFPGFAFGTYDVDVSADSLTMTLVANIDDLMITEYDNTTFDRYYFAFDQDVTSAELADTTDSNFSATIEILEPGTTVSTEGTFVEGLPSEFTFENSSILVTIGEGTDLTQVGANGGLTLTF